MQELLSTFDGVSVLFLLALGFFILAVSVGSMVFWIITLIDVMKRESLDHEARVLWAIVIALLGVIGSLVYFFKYMLPHKREIIKQKKKAAQK